MSKAKVSKPSKKSSSSSSFSSSSKKHADNNTFPSGEGKFMAASWDAARTLWQKSRVARITAITLVLIAVFLVSFRGLGVNVLSVGGNRWNRGEDDGWSLDSGEKAKEGVASSPGEQEAMAAARASLAAARQAHLMKMAEQNAAAAQGEIASGDGGVNGNGDADTSTTTSSSSSSAAAPRRAVVTPHNNRPVAAKFGPNRPQRRVAVTHVPGRPSAGKSINHRENRGRIHPRDEKDYSGGKVQTLIDANRQGTQQGVDFSNVLGTAERERMRLLRTGIGPAVDPAQITIFNPRALTPEEIDQQKRLRMQEEGADSNDDFLDQLVQSPNSNTATGTTNSSDQALQQANMTGTGTVTVTQNATNNMTNSLAQQKGPTNHTQITIAMSNTTAADTFTPTTPEFPTSKALDALNVTLTNSPPTVVSSANSPSTSITASSFASTPYSSSSTTTTTTPTLQQPQFYPGPFSLPKLAIQVSSSPAGLSLASFDFHTHDDIPLPPFQYESGSSKQHPDKYTADVPAYDVWEVAPQDGLPAKYTVCRFYRACVGQHKESAKDWNVYLDAQLQDHETQILETCGIDKPSFFLNNELDESYAYSVTGIEANMDLVLPYFADKQLAGKLVLQDFAAYAKKFWNYFFITFAVGSSRIETFERRFPAKARREKIILQDVPLVLDVTDLKPTLFLDKASFEKREKNISKTELWLYGFLAQMFRRYAKFYGILLQQDANPPKLQCFRSILVTAKSDKLKAKLKFYEATPFFKDSGLSPLAAPSQACANIGVTLLTKPAINAKSPEALQNIDTWTSIIKSTGKQIQPERDFDIQIFDIEALDYASIVNRLRDSQLLITPSTPNNIFALFLRPNTVLLEIHPFSFKTNTFQMYSSRFDVKYAFIMAEPNLEAFTECINKGNNDKEKDIVLPKYNAAIQKHQGGETLEMADWFGDSFQGRHCTRKQPILVLEPKIQTVIQSIQINDIKCQT